MADAAEMLSGVNCALVFSGFRTLDFVGNGSATVPTWTACGMATWQ